MNHIPANKRLARAAEQHIRHREPPRVQPSKMVKENWE